MNRTITHLSRFYSLLTVLYPRGFRREFAGEMQAVFHEKLVDMGTTDQWVLWRAVARELIDFPGAVLAEYVFLFRETLGRGLMSLVEDRSWKIENRRDAIIASLPSVIFGICIALGALVVWKPWYEIPRWRLLLGFAIMMMPGVVITLGGLWALKKRIPDWGYSWLGATAMGLLVFIKTLAEERADVGLPLITPALDIVVIIITLLTLAAVILFSAWRGWRHAGMVSLGFATIAGMSTFSMATAAPINRYDLALLAAPVGLVMSSLTYLFVRKGDLGRVLSMAGFGLLNAVMLLFVAQAWDLPSLRTFPVVPFLVVLTGALLVGPVTGIIGTPVRRIIQRT